MSTYIERLRLQKGTSKRVYLISPETALRYTAEFLLLVLFFSVRDLGFTLALGLFAGLVYARQNLLVVAPLFLIGGLVFFESWFTLLYLAVPVILFTLLYFVFWKLRRNVPSIAVVATTAVSMLPSCVCQGFFGESPLLVAASAVVAVIFSLSCTSACYAILIRGIKSRFTLDELICFSLFAVAFSFATYQVQLQNFRLFYLIMPFAVVYCVEQRTQSVALTLGILSGFGAALASGNIALCGICALWSAFAVAASLFTRFASAGAIILLQSALWLAGIDGGGGWQAITLITASVLVYCMLPSNIRGKYRKRGKDKTASLCSIVNRDRMELADRLSSVGEVFGNMSVSLAKADSETNPYTASRLAREVASSYCARCSDHNECFAALGGDTAPVLEQLADAALNRGKATILDMPTFITSRCSKTYNLTAVINNAAVAYRARISCAGEIINAKKLLSEQFAGMSLVLDSLAEECGRHLSFGGDGEERLESELLKHNIVASETVIAGTGADSKVAVTIRECDAGKSVLPKIISDVLRIRFAVDSIQPRGEDRTVQLVVAPVFEAAYGIAEKKRSGENVSGDDKAVLSPSLTKRIFAISDGMGSGEQARKNASDAISMIENFYKAGFEDALILSLVNKLLCLNDNECFSALDIAVIDTSKGSLDVIKQGAANGFLVRRDSVEVIKSSQPPIGILDRVSPITARFQLYDGDMLILLSDGVADVLGEKGVLETVEELNTHNPQTLADGLLVAALDTGATDDCTVVAVRLIAV